jgi:hypothetical protein
MPTNPTTTGALIDQSSDLIRFVDTMRATGRIDLAAYRALAPTARHIARLACRADAERRAAVGLLACGRVPRDVAATLLESADDGPWAA